MDADGGIGKHDDRLHERIRELEAELAHTRADSMKWDVIQKQKEKEQYDRAERGWERVEELAKKLGDAMARAEKAQARVAELERSKHFWLGLAECEECNVAHEKHAREREAE